MEQQNQIQRRENQYLTEAEVRELEDRMRKLGRSNLLLFSQILQRDGSYRKEDR